MSYSNMDSNITQLIDSHSELILSIRNNQSIIESIKSIVSSLINGFESGSKVLIAGNGGSAADAEHIAAELSGKLKIKRPPLFAEALHVNAAALTAISNDYSYESALARLLEAKAIPKDIVIVLSTSAKSENILNLIQKAKELDLIIIGFFGSEGDAISSSCDNCIIIPSTETTRIQEAYMLILHIICELVEHNLFAK